MQKSNYSHLLALAAFTAAGMGGIVGTSTGRSSSTQSSATETVRNINLTNTTNTKATNIGVDVATEVTSEKLAWAKRKSSPRWGYPNGPGWSHAKVQRMARKKRNQIRNRKAHRG